MADAEKATPSAEEARRARLRRAAELLGDLEPGGTRDDTDAGWGENPGGNDDDLRRNVPPHHG
ncbi:hypothetical protein [Aeromicrobium sp. Leaf350]|uniref:hypothetical protein n=1 Tax=Aeromicrobium sp. Leaf350 TaxID=2876565 RepID=UPI001E50DB40|nr:hypothetical protein [Aeromicrobium sp. Leaf350]